MTPNKREVLQPDFGWRPKTRPATELEAVMEAAPGAVVAESAEELLERGAMLSPTVAEAWAKATAKVSTDLQMTAVILVLLEGRSYRQAAKELECSKSLIGKMVTPVRLALTKALSSDPTIQARLRGADG